MFFKIEIYWVIVYLSNDICGTDGIGASIIICPACESFCDFARLNSSCIYSKVSSLYIDIYLSYFLWSNGDRKGKNSKNQKNSITLLLRKIFLNLKFFCEKFCWENLGYNSPFIFPHFFPYYLLYFLIFICWYFSCRIYSIIVLRLCLLL